MGRHVQYKRIARVITAKELDELLKKIIEDGFEIVAYSENILENSETVERIAISILCGKVNQGTQLLNS